MCFWNQPRANSSINVIYSGTMSAAVEEVSGIKSIGFF